MRRLILFAKRPRPGRVKTRLAASLGAERATGLYRAFLADEFARLRRFAETTQVELCVDEPWDEPGAAGLPQTLQGQGDLGRRLLRAFRRSHADGATATVVIGSDSPTLTDRSIDEAFDRLDRGSPAVVLPVADGGYGLIGLGEPLPDLFREIPWSGPAVLETTRRRASEAGWSLTELPPWYDVDDEEGLQQLRRDLADERIARHAPHTSRWIADDEAHGK